MNKGEISEYILKAFLLREKDERREDTIFGKITELSDDGELENATWQKKAESSLKKFDYHKIEKILGIGKSKTGTKADVSVNNVRYSVKEINSAPPAIVNHTPRNGFENVCERIGAQIDTLDSIIDEYWEKRIEGKITEDVSNSNEISPFLKYKKYLKPIINYFLFTGTGSKDSNFPADKVLLVKYKDLPEGLEIIKKEDYFESIWKHLVFSLRSKGMPPSYEHGNNEYESVRCWTKLKDGRYKGALHIRVKIKRQKTLS